MKISRNTLIFIGIYCASLAFMLWYNLSHPLVNDGVMEYNAYLQNVSEGWKFRQTLVNSCLITTWIPAMIQKVTNCDPMALFRVWPPLFYALMPSFTYLIAKKYLSNKYAVVTTLVVLLNSHILFFPDIGRVGVALGFMAGMIWALLEKRLLWAIVFALLVSFAHYGTGLISVGIIGVAFGVPLILKKRFLKKYLIVFAVLAIVVGVWHFGVAGYSGDVMSQTLFQTEQTGQILPQNPDIFDLTTRETAVQEAIGLNISGMSAPRKIEVIANWLVVLLVTIGVFFTARNKKIDYQFKVMAVAFWGLIVATVAIPWLSTYYGGMRVYFTSTVLLGLCFVLGAEKVANKMHLHPLILMSVVLIIYALSTSGIIYLPFGMEKTFPIAVSLP